MAAGLAGPANRFLCFAYSGDGWVLRLPEVGGLYAVFLGALLLCTAMTFQELTLSADMSHKLCHSVIPCSKWAMLI